MSSPNSSVRYSPSSKEKPKDAADAMSTAATRRPSSIPARPARSHESQAAVPAVPPRPAARSARAISPNPDRFAPSPFNDHFLAHSAGHSAGHAGLEREGSGGVASMPSVGEEGREYAAVAEELEADAGEDKDKTRRRSPSSTSTSPEQTRTVGSDLKLHAPQPSLPAASAKQRVMAVTRTDSDRAASFGIGEPGPGRARSSASHGSSSRDSRHGPQDEEHGIPEIGLQVPMCPSAGDVQAPSPAPGSQGDCLHQQQHQQHQSQSQNGQQQHEHLPPGSYGMHGHGVVSRDELDQAYYRKHPEQFRREHQVQLHDRQQNYAMSSEALNQIIRDTASKGVGLATHPGLEGVPSEEVGFQASEEYTSRMATPHPTNYDGPPADAPSAAGSTHISIRDGTTNNNNSRNDDDDTIHIDEPRRSSTSFSDSGSDRARSRDAAPILAPDEVSKSAPRHDMRPAVQPAPERSAGAGYEMEGAVRTRSVSRPAAAKPAQADPPQHQVRYDEPLFDEAGEAGEAGVGTGLAGDEDRTSSASQPGSKSNSTSNNHRRQPHHFPSRDIWEDVPNSAHDTAEVSTPDIPQQDGGHESRHGPAREMTETPAHIFARQQEALAEQELRGGERGAAPAPPPPQEPPQQHQLLQQHQPPPPPRAHRPAIAQRFPSRDVWEDAPESTMHETVVSARQESDPEAAEGGGRRAPDVPARPAIPPRPKPKHVTGDQPIPVPPPHPNKPKPQLPARPSKPPTISAPASDSSAGVAAEEPAAAATVKPAKPAKLAASGRAPGEDVAAIFMAGIKRRLQNFSEPEAVGKEGGHAHDGLSEDPSAGRERTPLADARKGRAKGPPRRAPAKIAATEATPAPAAAPAAAAPPAPAAPPALSFSMPVGVWAINPENGDIGMMGQHRKGSSIGGDEQPQQEQEQLQPQQVQAQVQEQEQEKQLEEQEPAATEPFQQQENEQVGTEDVAV